MSEESGDHRGKHSDISGKIARPLEYETPRAPAGPWYPSRFLSVSDFFQAITVVLLGVGFRAQFAGELGLAAFVLCSPFWLISVICMLAAGPRGRAKNLQLLKWSIAVHAASAVCFAIVMAEYH